LPFVKIRRCFKNLLRSHNAFDAWNRHDAAAIVGAFAETGTYADPVTPGPLTGAAIGAYAQGLWEAFPNLSFDIVSVTENASGLVSAEWLMKGTNTGPFSGLPPTGVAVALPGADFIRVDAGKIQNVHAKLPAPLGIGRAYLTPVVSHSVGKARLR
jgi:steroid delta-isomerase-like uncharacterized protein